MITDDDLKRIKKDWGLDRYVAEKYEKSEEIVEQDWDRRVIRLIRIALRKRGRLN